MRMSFDHFGILAPFYDRVIGSRAFDKLISLAGLPIDGRLLDAGGGTGRVTQALRGLASQLIIVDVSHGMLRQALPKGDLAPVCSAVERLPFSSGDFERIVVVDALHHVYSQQATATELWRVLAPGGRLVIEEPDVRKLAGKFIAVAEKVALMRSNFLTPGKIAGLFPRNGCSVQIVDDGFNVYVVVTKQIET
jgi:ubiquinone/menaquinone biosynthesis C-methylase UbiE